jgi:hypothetical protein
MRSIVNSVARRLGQAVVATVHPHGGRLLRQPQGDQPRYRGLDLMWRPVGRLVRFIIVHLQISRRIHPEVPPQGAVWPTAAALG